MKPRQHIAVSVIWYKAYLDGYEALAFNPSIFPRVVWAFYGSLIDLDKDEMAIKTKVKEYIETNWQPQIDAIVNNELKRAFSETAAKKTQIRNDTEQLFIIDLFNKIIQTIQDSGIGWPTDDEYKSYMISQE